MSEVNLTKIAKQFGDEDSARSFLEALRWPEGPICPHCDSTGAYKIIPKSSGRGARKGLYKCSTCRKQFTVTVGTVFEDTHIPLNKWLLALHLISSSKKGMSAHQLHRMLGITYKSAWFMAHRLRYAMNQPPLKRRLVGVVEVDETYIGGKAKGKRGRGAANKTPVVALVKRGGKVYSQPVERVTAESLKFIIRKKVDRRSEIMTDDFRSYGGLEKEFKRHGVVNHTAGEYVKLTDKSIHTNTVEGFFSLLKRGITGTFHHVSKHHLHRYCHEFNFRYNHRSVSDGERTCAIVLASEGKRLTYKETSKANNSEVSQ